MILRLAIASLFARALTVGMTILAIALSVALYLGVEKVRTGAKASVADTSPSPFISTPPPRTRKPESPRFDRLEVNALTEVNGVKPTVEIDSMVEVRVADVSFFGVVRWLGSLLDQDMKVAGIELVGIELRNLVPARLTVWFFLFTGG